MTTLRMMASSSVSAQNFSAMLGNQYVPDVNGIYLIQQNDIVGALQAGLVPAQSEGLKNQTISAPAALNAVLIVASAALSNGALTIANQVDMPRQVVARIDPGAAGITAGTLTAVYVANDGTTQTDVLSLIMPTTTPVTLGLSKGVLKMVSATVAGLVGGSSPKVQMGTTATLAVNVAPGFVAFTALAEHTDGTDNAIGTVTAANGLWAPTTAPNGTHSYTLGYTYTMAA